MWKDTEHIASSLVTVIEALLSTHAKLCAIEPDTSSSVWGGGGGGGWWCGGGGESELYIKHHS